MLQLLRPEHSCIVRLFGGASGRDIDKRNVSADLGFGWLEAPAIASGSDPSAECTEATRDATIGPMLLLPGCQSYLRLTLVGALIDAGNHDVAVCRVTDMFVDDDQPKVKGGHLTTGYLRDLGIISAAGRVVPTITPKPPF